MPAASGCRLIILMFFLSRLSLREDLKRLTFLYDCISGSRTLFQFFFWYVAFVDLVEALRWLLAKFDPNLSDNCFVFRVIVETFVGSVNFGSLEERRSFITLT